MSSPKARDHAWLPRATCDTDCLRAGGSEASRRLIVALRVALRIGLGLLVAPALLMVAVPLPGRSQAKRVYCHLLLWCLGVRITVSGGPIRNLPGVLVVSEHMSWLDIVTIAAVLPTTRWRTAPASFVGRADVAANLAVRMLACIIKVIPIDRASLRQLPGVVDTVAARLRAGQTVVAFPEGTTWCGAPGDDAGREAARGEGGRLCPGSGKFYPAMFQAAVDTGRPVQPLRLRYYHRDGRVSTVPAYIGDETLLRSIGRLLVARQTVAQVYVESLQLPGADRRELARRCQAAIRTTTAPHPGHGQRRRVLTS
jgi:1-acyl-sn-glycerol-3-phosphate acyltransferase